MAFRMSAVFGITIIFMAGCSGGPDRPFASSSTEADNNAATQAGPDGDPGPGVTTPVDGEWRLTGLGGETVTPRGDPIASHELVYRFENGHGSLREKGAARGDGFTYSANEEHVKIRGGKEEGLVDTAEIFESQRLYRYNYSISGDTMSWWLFVNDPENPEGKKTVYTFRRIGRPPAGEALTSIEGIAPVRSMAVSAEGDEAGNSRAIDGRWRLKQALGTPIPRVAANLVYEFENGSGTFEKNGKPKGDGFRFTADPTRITISGADDEGLLDTGPDSRHYSHYNYTIVGGEMSWWVNDSFSSGDRKVLYVFEICG